MLRSEIMRNLKSLCGKNRSQQLNYQGPLFIFAGLNKLNYASAAQLSSFLNDLHQYPEPDNPDSSSLKNRLKTQVNLHNSITTYQPPPIVAAPNSTLFQPSSPLLDQVAVKKAIQLAIDIAAYIIQIERQMGSDQAKPLAPNGQLKLNHHYFQKATLVKEGDKQFVQSLLDVQDKEYDAWKKTITDTTKPLNHEFLYLPEKTGYQHGKELCGNNGTAINLYPHYPVILADEIKKRATDKTYFKESQLWYLLYSLIAAKNDLAAHSGRLGDVNPHNVFINSERKVKVGNVYSVPGEKTGFAKVLDKKGHEHVLLPPEDLVEAKKNAIDNKNNSKSEIFSIGATVLSAGILEDLGSVYDFKSFSFNSKEFDEKKKHWINHEKYSEIFKSTILNLVNELPDKRLSQAELWNYVAPHAGSIKNKEQFLINHPPALIESNVSVVRSKAL